MKTPPALAGGVFTAYDICIDISNDILYNMAKMDVVL
jgi:hypothetical protein